MNVFALPTKFRYISYQPNLTSPLPKITKFNLKLPISVGYESQKTRVLLVLGHIPTEDLRAKYVFQHTEGGTVLSSMFRYGKHYSRRVSETLDIKMREEFGLAAIDFNFIKFYDLPDRERDQARAYCAKRVRQFIREHKPTHIVFVGSDQQDYVLRQTNSWIYRGIIKEGSIGEHKFLYTNVVDFNKVLGAKQNDTPSDTEEFNAVHIAGHISRQIAHLCYLNQNPFTCPNLEPHPIVVDTIKRFKKLMEKLRKAREVAIDTETTSLSRVEPTVLTIQFALNEKCGYIIPLEHKDTPFSKKELEYIKSELRNFFLEVTPKVIFLGQNFKFDLTVLRVYLNVPLIDASVWDAMGAEFALDENVVVLRDLTGHSHLALDGLLASYGCDYYQQAKFSKSDRDTISTVTLDKNVLNYCALDVQSLFAIKRLQLLRAQCEDYNGKPYKPVYERFVLNQISSIVQIMSHMEQTGIRVDLKYTMELAAQNGPLRSSLTSTIKKLYAMPSVKKANRMLSKKQGGAQKGLFGEVQYTLFDVGKPAHKLLLYIDILDLAPVNFTSTKTPSINAAFQARHKSVPEVAALIEISKVQKLLSTFVEKFLKIISYSTDGKKTLRIFPSFGYTKAVTGRGVSYDPNFQQIPSRGEKAKLVKRMFVAPPECILVKLDFSAHEVRGWSLISFDKVLADVFKIGRELRKKFYKSGGEALRKAIELKGDVHKLNYNFFFGVPVEKITKDQRDSVKSVAFGTIYGKSDRSLAKDIKDSVEAATKLRVRFFKRFGRASDWLEATKKKAKEKYYTYSPIGRRRNLFGYFFANPGVRGATDRQAMNAPIQGLAADIGHYAGWLFLKLAYKILLKREKEKPRFWMPIRVRCMVHDSIFVEVERKYAWLVLHLLHYATTVGVTKEFERIYNFKFTIPPEVDIEVGYNEKDLYKWDWSPESLQDCLKKTAEDIAKAEAISSSKIYRELVSGKEDKELVKYLNETYPVFVD
jgi:DNA polymerase I-like protein with 3'-5' exonuclease and polymerase domains